MVEKEPDDSIPSSEDDAFPRKRERVRALFDKYDRLFRTAADTYNMRYCGKAGPSFGRAVYLTGDVCGGVFLELIERWLDCDDENPQVSVAYMTRVLNVDQDPDTICVLSKEYFEGGMNELNESLVESWLNEACAEISAISNGDILARGKRLGKPH